MRVVIYGAGAVGLGLGSCLIGSGQDVVFVAREETVELLRQNGLQRRGIFGEQLHSADSFRCYSSLWEFSCHNIDYVLVCTKTYDNRSAAEELSRLPSLYSQRTRIVVVQNGWGNAEVFREYFPESNIYCARVITGFQRSARNQVEVTVHADSVHIGNIFSSSNAQLTELCEAISRGGIPARCTKEIRKDLWAKMLYNCALNPLGAILNVRYGDLAGCSATREIMNGVIGEVFQVMEAQGDITHWNSTQSYTDEFYGRLIPATADHESSMLQDIRAKRRTEIDSLNGAVMSLGAKHKVPVAQNSMMFNMVKAIEQGAMSPIALA